MNFFSLPIIAKKKTPGARPKAKSGAKKTAAKKAAAPRKKAATG